MVRGAEADGLRLESSSKGFLGADSFQLLKGPPIHPTGFGNGSSMGGLFAEAVSAIGWTTLGAGPNTNIESILAPDVINAVVLCRQ